MTGAWVIESVAALDQVAVDRVKRSGLIMPGKRMMELSDIPSSKRWRRSSFRMCRWERSAIRTGAGLVAYSSMRNA
jgi:hypothetical protein